MNYLKLEQYYIDRYDLITIKDCLDVVNLYRDLYKKKDSDEKLQKIPPEEIEKGFGHFLNWHLVSKKANWYQRKTATVQEWMENDRIKQERLDNTDPPTDVHCTDCKIEMKLGNFKHLMDHLGNNESKVLFFFDCPKCNKRKGVYDDGEEHIFEPSLCPECGSEMEVSSTKCQSCNYQEIEEYDWELKKREREDQEKNDQVLLDTYRSEFCFSNKEGQECVDLFEALEVANVVREEVISKYDNPIYELASQLKKIKIADVEKVLTKALSKAKFDKLALNKPQIGQYVDVSFSVQDTDTTRSERISQKDLIRVINEALKQTNWRMVINSVAYRLGFLTGQLIGYESEEDLLKLVGKQNKPKFNTKIDPKTRNKYSHHNVVQLARMLGEHEGIENVRKRRLKNEPDGFFLQENEGPYSCGICGENHYGNKIWWNLDGLQCANCRLNIQKGVIPPLECRYDKDKSYFLDWEIKPKYGVHPATTAKLRRQGILVGRDLKNTTGSTYCTVYLKNENQRFLTKHRPK